jgi:AcrR family transcriptional regulator
VHDLLQTTSVQDLTIEGIARRAGVGKPTLYKWWGTKADIVLAMVNERVEPTLDPPADLSLEASVQFKARRLVEAFNGFFGRVMAGLIAEAQHDPDLQGRINQAYILPRRAGTIADIRKAQSDGAFPAEIDPEIIVDQIFGSLYFHLLTGVHPLTHAYADQLVETVFSQVRRKT